VALFWSDSDPEKCLGPNSWDFICFQEEFYINHCGAWIYNFINWGKCKIYFFDVFLSWKISKTRLLSQFLSVTILVWFA
jgi:hypothetical protein